MENFHDLQNFALKNRAQGVNRPHLSDVEVDIYGTENSKGAVQFNAWFRYRAEAENLNFVEQDSKKFCVYVNFIENGEQKRSKYGEFKFCEPLTKLKDSVYIGKITVPSVRQHIEHIVDCLITLEGM